MPGIRTIYKAYKNRRLAGKTTTARRVNRVFPQSGKRMVAITFDDGPSMAAARPSQEPITPAILDILKSYGAKGTFDVIGTTRYRYPDRKGENGGAYWNGVFHDHYPEFGQDHLGGVVAQPDLARRMVDEDHEISNHGMTHTAFGPQYYPYFNRRYLANFEAVMRDLAELHDLVESVTGQRIRMGRPAHYIDKTADGFDSYDAYSQMGYLYLGASFDGGGWQASCGDYVKDVDSMVERLESALSRDAACLNGQIIFHKDGYNMSSQAPAVEGLRRQLAVLKSYEYEVVTVSRLLSESEFTDIGPNHPVYASAALLVRHGYPVTFADNCVRPDAKTSVGEIARMAVPARHINGGANEGIGTSPGKCGPGTTRNQVIANALAFSEKGQSSLFRPNRQVPVKALYNACRQMVEDIPSAEDERMGRLRLLSERTRLDSHSPATRGQAIVMLAAALVGQ